MGALRERNSAAEISTIALGIGVLFLVTPVRLVWARAEVGWGVAFGVWLGLVGLAVWCARATRREMRERPER
ncbi:hypothetical protein [Chondromyces apiculatus]|uniref:hypothetical protein n=1 Tax=Chondromyces apiculatus TaxID=51 RepID=UPI0012DF92D8|nr:hypothetical protein [Chondromyces apiculatus]